jgi:hypothetical protein
MKKAFYIFTIMSTISLTLFSSCSNKDGMKQEDVALQTAKAYYDQLVNGDYATFVDGTLQNDSIPEDYKAQLILNMQMYIEQQKKAHQGIARVEALRATCDSVKLPNDSTIMTAQAFLALCFKDSMREEIVVPMVKKNDIWYLR